MSDGVQQARHDQYSLRWAFNEKVLHNLNSLALLYIEEEILRNTMREIKRAELKFLQRQDEIMKMHAPKRPNHACICPFICGALMLKLST